MGQHNGWLKKGTGDAGKINGLLDKGTSFEGKLTFDGVLQINGEFRGEIYSDGTLIVGPQAAVNAHIVVDSIVIDGCVEGVLEVQSRVELHASGRLVGDVATERLVIEDGGLFHGTMRMKGVERVVQRGEGVGEEGVFVAPDTDSAVN